MAVKKLIVVIIFVLFGNNVFAEFQKVINYQGKLTDKQNNVLTGTFRLTFFLYKDINGDGVSETQVWTETHDNVLVQQGNYSVLLGNITEFAGPYKNIFLDKLWLGIKVGNDNEMTPRVLIAPTPNAVVSYDCLSMVGMVGIFPATKQGWLICDGKTLHPTDAGADYTGEQYRHLYEYLYNSVNANFRSGDYAVLPNLAGQFIRGSAFLDVNSHSAETNNGIPHKRDAGDAQADSFESHSHGCVSAGSHSHSGSTSTAGAHSHTYTYYPKASTSDDKGNNHAEISKHATTGTTSSAGAHSHSLSIDSAGNHSHTIQNSGGNETRPVNVAMFYLIKY